jgi:hypothetical protein
VPVLRITWQNIPPLIIKEERPRVCGHPCELRRPPAWTCRKASWLLRVLRPRIASASGGEPELCGGLTCAFPLHRDPHLPGNARRLEALARVHRQPCTSLDTPDHGRIETALGPDVVAVRGDITGDHPFPRQVASPRCERPWRGQLWHGGRHKVFAVVGVVGFPGATIMMDRLTRQLSVVVGTLHRWQLQPWQKTRVFTVAPHRV